MAGIPLDLAGRKVCPGEGVYLLVGGILGPVQWGHLIKRGKKGLAGGGVKFQVTDI